VALKSDGTLWAWGSNGFGQLGDGTTTNRSTPTQIGSETNWALISTDGPGGNTTMALKSDGTLWGWGRNNFGQLGDGTTTNRSTPTQEATGATNWALISTGGAHTVALKSDGTLWAWGSNGFGQLGDGTTTNRSTPTQEATGATNWALISAGGVHTVALKSDGTIWSWGGNNWWQLGSGGYSYYYLNPIQEYTGATNWTAIAAGQAFTVAIK